jgi:protein involved in polysaccharide export with SLBB domain
MCNLPESPSWSPDDNHRAARWLVVLAAAVLGAFPSGCAALANPFGEGIPVRKLPPELLAPPHEDQTIPLTLLSQPRPPVYRLAPGDVLGVYIEGILGERNLPLPIHVAPQVQLRDQRHLPAAVGYPVPVREDGTIGLPLVDPLKVQGKTLSEAQAAVRDLYLKKQLLKEGQERILVTLLNPRQFQILVLRQEAGSFNFGPEGLISSGKRGTGHVVDLFAYENDVLHALTQSGGLPGLDALNEVIIFRGCFRDDQGRAALLQQFETLPPGASVPGSIGHSGPIVRIPLRAPHGACPPIRAEDVVLNTGDVVLVEARVDQLYYTAGLLPAGEHVLPRDYSLDVLKAVAQVRGPMFNGAFATNNLSGNLLLPGVGNPSPSLLVVLRQMPNGSQLPILVDLNRAVTDPRERILVQAGDVLILQEEPGEAFARYFSQTFLNFNLFWQVVHDRNVTGVIDVSAPDRLSNRLGVVNVGPR